MFVLRRTLKEVKLFQSYFVTYFIVLLIPFIAFWGIYVKSTEAIREGIENENRILLEQTTSILDTRFKEVESIGIQLINSSCVTQLRYLEDPLTISKSCYRPVTVFRSIQPITIL